MKRWLALPWKSNKCSFSPRFLPPFSFSLFNSCVCLKIRPSPRLDEPCSTMPHSSSDHHYYDDDGDLYDSPTYDYYVDDFGDDSFDGTSDDYSVHDSEDDFYDSSTSDSLDVEGGGIPSDDGKGLWGCDGPLSALLFITLTPNQRVMNTFQNLDRAHS